MYASRIARKCSSSACARSVCRATGECLSDWRLWTIRRPLARDVWQVGDALGSPAMRAGMWNLGFGLVAVAAGASGQFTLLGTGSSTWLMIAGGLLAAFALVR